MENKYEFCQSQEERDLIDQGFKICASFDCGEPFKYTSDFYPEFCSSRCYEGNN